MRHRVILAADLQEGGEVAYAHALRLAVAARGHLVVLNVHGHDAASDWAQVPRATARLRRWGLLPEDATVAEFATLGVDLHLSGTPGLNPAVELVHEIERNEPDLVVMQAHGRADAVDRLLHPSVSETVARRVTSPTLVLPPQCRPFVEEDTGDLRLSHVLIAAGDVHDQAVIDAAARFVRDAGVERCHGTVLHLGEARDLEAMTLAHPGWIWDTEVGQEPVIDAILRAVADRRPDLLVIGTRGHDSLGDALFGSHAERVLRAVDVPVLVVPLR